MAKSRKEQYETKMKQLEVRCVRCRKIEMPSVERCNYHCFIGFKIRMLETEYSDITGWKHDTWKLF